jgi:quercetin dioxygenase-like cupin family protein
MDADEVRTAAKQLVKEFDSVFATDDVQVNHMVLAPGQEVPWHLHTEVGDTLYVVRGPVTIYTRVPDETRIGETGDTVQTPAGQAHRVVNESDHDVATILIQGVGTYDFHLVLDSN